jgi:hypothetical protein
MAIATRHVENHATDAQTMADFVALDPHGLMNPGKLLGPASTAPAAPVPTFSED